MNGTNDIEAVLAAHKLWLNAGPGKGKQANLAGADLRRADLYGADLRRADLYGAYLADANLYGADLRGADLYGADLRGADLAGAYLLGANLTGAYLRGEVRAGADLAGADLRRANLYGANLYGANLDETKGVVWARIGPVGAGPRELLGVWQGDEGLVIYGGCFRGTVDQFRKKVDDGGWDWPENDIARHRLDCLDALSRIESSVTRWLEACNVEEAGDDPR